MKVLKNIAILLGVGLVCGLAVCAVFVGALVFTEHFVAPLPKEGVKIPSKVFTIDVCDLVERGALQELDGNCAKRLKVVTATPEALSVNSKTPVKADTLEVVNSYEMQPFGVGAEDELTTTQATEPTYLGLQVTRHYERNGIDQTSII